MASISEYAQLSLLVYDVPDINRIDLPSTDWKQLDYLANDPATGFSYGVYENEKTNEIVIAYTGTNEGFLDGFLISDDWLANLGNGSGTGSDQLAQAALVAARIIAENPGKTITFTGHSLGGGLASVMAVWFDKQAIVFDEAPFMNAALSPITYEAVQNYAANQTPAGSPIYILNNPEFQDYNPLKYPARAGNVTNYFVTGEAMQVLEAATPILTDIPLLGIGNDVSIDFGHSLNTGFEVVDPVKLHAQTLMTAGWMVPALRGATQTVTNFLPAAFDSRLYGVSDRKTSSKDFLTKLIQSEQEHPGSGNLTHLAVDLNTFGSHQSQLNDFAKDGIVAQMVEWYRWQANDYSDPFFFGSGGGVLQYATAQGDKLAGAENRAEIWVSGWLEPLFVGCESALPKAKAAEQWNVAANPFTWASANKTDKTQLFIGGDGADDFTGGEVDDVLLGGKGDDTLRGLDGDDILIGGEGADRLEGGTGYDRYYVDSQDTIKDEDGAGSVTLDNYKLGLATRKKGETEYKDGSGNTFDYTEPSDGNKGSLTVNGSLNIEDYTNGDLGIVLVEKPDDPMEPIRDKARAASQYTSPLILDLDGDGVETTSLTKGAYFDHAADGFAELSGWVGQDDGLLARDLNGNGLIDSGRELLTLEAAGVKSINIAYTNSYFFQALMVRMNDSLTASQTGRLVEAASATIAANQEWLESAA